MIKRYNMIFFKFFTKFKFHKRRKKNLYEINPEEFIMISENLMKTTNTAHKLLGIIMASGAPLSHLKNQSIAATTSPPSIT